jgi:hypothetical protein
MPEKEYGDLVRDRAKKADNEAAAPADIAAER